MTASEIKTDRKIDILSRTLATPSAARTERFADTPESVSEGDSSLDQSFQSFQSFDSGVEQALVSPKLEESIIDGRLMTFLQVADLEKHALREGSADPFLAPQSAAASTQPLPQVIISRASLAEDIGDSSEVLGSDDDTAAASENSANEEISDEEVIVSAPGNAYKKCC